MGISGNAPRHGGQALRFGQRSQQIRGTDHGIARQGHGGCDFLFRAFDHFNVAAGLGVPLVFQSADRGGNRRIVDHDQAQLHACQRLAGRAVRRRAAGRASGEEEEEDREKRGESAGSAAALRKDALGMVRSGGPRSLAQRREGAKPKRKREKGGAFRAILIGPKRRHLFLLFGPFAFRLCVKYPLEDLSFANSPLAPSLLSVF